MITLLSFWQALSDWLPWLGVGLLAAAAVASYMHPLAPRWLAVALAGVALVLALLLLWQAQISAAYDRGMNDCTVAHATAAAVQAKQAQERVNGADNAAAAEIASVGRVETVYVDRVRKIYRNRPARACIDADGVRLIREADTATGSSAPGNSLDAVRAADAAG